MSVRTSTAPAELANYAVLRKGQAPGNTCLGACSQGATGTLEQLINGSKGCGGVMRVAPVRLCLGLDTDEAFELAARCAAQTHGHPSGYYSAGVMAVIVRAVLDGLDMLGAIGHALDIARCREGPASL